MRSANDNGAFIIILYFRHACQRKAENILQSLRSDGNGIVRGFLRNLDIMRMAFVEARVGDAAELRLGMQLLDVGAAGVAHAGTQTAHQLVNGVGKRSLVRHAALDAFRNKLLRVLLEIAVAAALPHGGEAAHAAVHLEAAALIQLGFARGFLAAREQRTDHDDVGARGERLDDVAGVLDAAVRDDRNAVLSAPRRPRHKSR